MQKDKKYPEFSGDRNKNWKGGKTQCSCEVCGKEFLTYTDEKHKGRFCSKECKYIAYKGTGNPCFRDAKITRSCLTCGNEFEVFKKNRVGKFCSMSCSTTYTIKHHIKKSDTDIERILENFLQVMGTEFEKQKIIEGICVADFFVEPNIVFFADGDYWHSLPKRIITDKRVNERLKNAGYDVIRILGSSLKHGLSNFKPLEL